MFSRFDRAAVSIAAGVRVALRHPHVPSACSAAAATAARVLSRDMLSSAHSALPAGLVARCFTASAILLVGDGASVGDGVGVNTSADVAPAASAGKTRTFWAQRPGAKDSAAVMAAGSMFVGLLKKEIKKELELDVALDSISLQLASEDGTLFTAKDAAGSPQPVTLNSMDTIDEALQKAAKEAGRVIKPEDKLRIIVDVAAPAATPAASEDGILRTGATADEVYALLGPQARAAVDAARAHRKRLADNRVLKGLMAIMPAVDAEALGIQVLRKDDVGNMAVGMFDVAALSAVIAEPPKTFDDMATESLQVLLLPQRLRQAFELVDAVVHGRRLGVHLSGPNGVGKSAIALLAYLLCAARGVPAVYIARAESWVHAARQEDGGDAYFLKAFWRQNADLIIEQPALRSIFAAVLHDGAAPFTQNVVDALRAAVLSGAVPGLAVIMDEVQHITKAVHAASSPLAPTSSRLAGEYFATNWYDWTNDNAVFQRMSVASAHAHRDTKLPDGEAHRLRFVEPLDPADRAVLHETPQSPAYIYDLAARERAVYIGGNILRKVITAARLLPRDCKPTKRELSRQWTTMWDDMLADSKLWLQSVPEPERTRVARTAMDVVTGKVAWSRAEQLYDAGVVFRTAESELVQPVSTVACAVILRVMASHALQSATPLSSISDGRERGFELERQFLGQVDGFNYDKGVPTKLLDGSPAPAVDLRCGYALPFTHVSELVTRDVPVLYRPTSGSYACDGVLMPAATDGDKGKILLIECSTREPLHRKRVRKVHNWFRPNGIVAQMRALHPGLTACVVLAYDGLLPDRTTTVLPSSEKVIALSKGEAPAASAGADADLDADDDDDDDDADAVASWSSTSSLSRKDAAHGAAAQASKSTAPSGGRGRPKKLLPASTAALPRLGDVVRVVDAPSLTTPLRLLK